MDNESLLITIREFADKAHGTQLRKYTSERYIAHPIRVMNTCSDYINRLEVLAAALLHDVLEDTPVTATQIFAFLTDLLNSNQARTTLKLVQELTDVYEKQHYPEWNRKQRKFKEAQRLATVSPEAQTVKYADIIDNNREIMQHDPGFGRMYSRECRALLEKMTKGNVELRTRAVAVVERNFQLA